MILETRFLKVLYSGAAFTKAHVIDYYLRVGEWLLPHNARRPVTLQRFPDGVRGKTFYDQTGQELVLTIVDELPVATQAVAIC